MSNFTQLIEANTEAARIAAHPETQFKDIDSIGDLVLRNTVVALGRLEPQQYNSLSIATKDLVADTVRIAGELAPMAAEDMVIHPHESALDYAYRVNIRQPIGTLQARLNAGDLHPQTLGEVDKVKKALHVGAAAFAAVVYDSIDHETIRATEDYFWGNTTAALARAERLSKND